MKGISTQVLFKSGMIGNVFGFYASTSGNNVENKIEEISGDIFYIDNVMHEGSSGGPIITKDGKVIGIISKKAMVKNTSENDDGVPAGTTIGISNRFINGLYPKILEFEKYPKFVVIANK